MELRTASSNSMGPGMSSVACSGWDDMAGDEVWIERRDAGVVEVVEGEEEMEEVVVREEDEVGAK